MNEIGGDGPIGGPIKDIGKYGFISISITLIVVLLAKVLFSDLSNIKKYSISACIGYFFGACGGLLTLTHLYKGISLIVLSGLYLGIGIFFTVMTLINALKRFKKGFNH